MTNAYLDSFSLGPIQVVDEHFDAVLLNCYDAIGIMLIIRIIHQHQVFLSFPL
jgi:vacuolar protein sorting-associated protein 52